MPEVLNIKNYDYKVPDGAVYVGRAMPRYNLPDSKWGNPFKIGVDGDRETVINLFRNRAITRLDYDPHWLDELKGKDLVCWCSPLPCHADVLLELANKGGE